MNIPLSVPAAVAGLMQVTARISSAMAWVLFLLVHLSLVVCALVALWWLQISPAQMKSGIDQAVLSSPLSSIAQTLAVLGISALAILVIYAKAWQWLLRKLLNEYLFYEKA